MDGRSFIAQSAKEQIRQAQIEAAIAAGQTPEQLQSAAISGYYDVETQKVVIELSNGAEYGPQQD